MRCPCRKKSETLAYQVCCGRFHGGVALPETAEALMRSRFTAFAQQNEPYLLSTWHTSTRPESLDFEVGRDWYMLKITETATDGDRAIVAFSARSRMAGRTHDLVERSRFVRDGGRWFYVDGEITP